MLKRSPKIVFLPRRAKGSRHPRWRASLARLDARIAELERRFGSVERSAPFTLGARMRAALVASLGVHLAIIYGVGFKVPGKPPVNAQQALEVVLVNAKSQTRPTVADALAQHNLDGGGTTAEKRRAQTPLPAVPQQKSEAEMKLAQKRVEKLEREARQVLAQTESPARVETPQQPSKPAPATEPDAKPLPSASEIMNRGLELARLEAKIARDWNAYQERPRRRFIGSRTQEYRFARYVEDWRQKIERVGDLNYPQGARDQRLHGRLVVTVAIKADGTVDQVDINVPSGHKLLDDAARRIVQLAAPFSPFPPDIAKDVDILHITRTWTFTTADRFVSD
jgi:periplasmic protein TonB